MAVAAALWAELLAGDEVAYLGSAAGARGPHGAVPRRSRPAAVVGAVGGGELYSHQREVWDRSRTGAHVASHGHGQRQDAGLGCP